MASKEEVQIVLGVNIAQVQAGLVAARDQFSKFGQTTKTQIKGIGDSMKFMNLGMGAFAALDRLEDWMAKAKDLGQWWGAFSVGGEKAVAMMQRAAGEIDRIYETTKKLRKNRVTLDELFEEKKKKLMTDSERIADLEEQRQKLLMQQVEIERKINDQHLEREDRLVAELKLTDVFIKLEKLEIEQEERKDKVAKERAEKEEKAAKAKIDATEKLNDISDKLYDTTEKIYQTEQKLTKEKADARRRINSDYAPSIDDLAKGGSNYSFAAQQYLREKAFAEKDFFKYGLKDYRGRDTGVQKQIEYAEKMKDPLVKAGFLGPQETIAMATKETVEELKQLNSNQKDLIRKFDES